MYSRFGLEQLNKKTELDNVLKSVEKIDSLSAQMILREAYEISYNIFDHEYGEYHPWNLVLDRHKEDYANYGTLYRTIHNYHLREVYKRFGLNLVEFLELPREFVELIFSICTTEDTKRSKMYENIKDELEDSFNK